MSEIRLSFPNPCAERWDEMRADGRNRFCESCTTVVHDLSNLTVDEHERLLTDPRKHCVRVEVRRSGSVVSKLRSGQNQKRMLMAIGTSIGLFTSGCETAPHVAPQMGILVGEVGRFSDIQKVTAISEDGKKHQAKVRQDGTYRFRALPVGSYSLQFISICDSFAGGTIALQPG